MVLLDNGGFFPEQDNYEDVAWFLMDGMKMLGTSAVGVGDRDLRYGRSFLLANWKRTQLPLVCTNLFDKATKKPLVNPWLVVSSGGVKVGVFGLMTDKADLGISRDSLMVDEPTAAAKRAVAELRKKGATIVVLLSQLGKVESEDLVTGVDGIDAVIVGRNVPLLQKGRLIKNTIACYGGEQGQYMGQTVVTLNAQKRMTTADNETFILGPEVGEKAEVLALVKSFEDSFNDKLRRIEKERAAKAQIDQENNTQSVDKYMGAEVCARCHTSEYEQWKTTGHARAWQTLVDEKKESTPDCVPCHVVGYKQPGGFQTAGDAPKLGNVQCENCHGMGTEHDSYPAQSRRITEATCQSCHNATTSPEFNFAIFEPHIVHKSSGQALPPLPANPAKMMKSAGH